MTKAEIKNKAQDIKEYYAGIPEQQISPGHYVDRVGRKYVHCINTWDTTTLYKVKIEDWGKQHRSR